MFFWALANNWSFGVTSHTAPTCGRNTSVVSSAPLGSAIEPAKDPGSGCTFTRWVAN
jgi:hypothetical protein